MTNSYIWFRCTSSSGWTARPINIAYPKLSVTGGESALLRRYHCVHPKFPHQTTLGRFFDERQFEAYRQLGVPVAVGLFAHCPIGKKGSPKIVLEWFRQLASNLMEGSMAVEIGKGHHNPQQE